MKKVIVPVLFFLCIPIIAFSQAPPAGPLGYFQEQINTLQQQLQALQTQVNNIQLTPGPQGPVGPQGPQGPSGTLASFDSLQGLECTRNGKTGAIDISFSASGIATLTCVVDLECKVPSTPLGSCPTVCTGGCNSVGLCAIDCIGPGSCRGARIDCPTGWNCVVNCVGSLACAEVTVNCDAQGLCDLHCEASSAFDVCKSALVNCGMNFCSQICDIFPGPGLEPSIMNYAKACGYQDTCH
jgi:hypothetical protein